MKFKFLFVLALSALMLNTSDILGQETNTQENGEAEREERRKIRLSDSLFNAGNADFRAGRYQDAIQKYTNATNIRQDHKYYYQLGLAYSQTRSFDKAIVSFQAANKIKPDFYLGFFGLGNTFLRMQQFDKAIENYKEARKDPTMVNRVDKIISEAYAGYAQKLYDEGLFKEAGEVIDDAQDKHPDNPKLFLIAARVYNRLEKPDQAIDMAKKAIEVKKDQKTGAEWFEIGVGNKKLSKFPEAREAFQKAAKDPLYARNAQYELDSIKGR